MMWKYRCSTVLGIFQGMNVEWRVLIAVEGNEIRRQGGGVAASGEEGRRNEGIKSHISE